MIIFTTQRERERFGFQLERREAVGDLNGLRDRIADIIIRMTSSSQSS